MIKYLEGRNQIKYCCPTQDIPAVVTLTRAGGPCPDSDTVRSSDWLTGLSSSFVLERLMAEWGTKAPGVLKG